MITSYECIPCFARQAAEAVAMGIADPDQRQSILRCLIQEIATSDWNETPPAIAQRLHRIVREKTRNADPYEQIKKDMNTMAAAQIPAMREYLAQSKTPRKDAVRLAIAGNLLDAGAKTQCSAKDLPAHLNAVFERTVYGDMNQLFEAVDQASTILYLADNAGEIYFDRLLIEALPTNRITVAVRGAPTINDATLADAEAAGISAIVPVISNGSDAPGTILKDTSPEFQKLFQQADVVISKGQGNYETLSDCGRSIFFLLTVKCSLVAESLGEAVGSMVVKAAG